MSDFASEATAAPRPGLVLALAAWALCLVLAVPTIALLAIGPGQVLPSDVFSGLGGAAFLVVALAFGTVGAVVTWRVPGNRIGPIFCLTGVAIGLQVFLWQYADVGLNGTHGLPAVKAAAVADTVFGEATAGLLGLALLLFPDGRLPTRRWWPALASLIAGMALLVLANTLRPGPYTEPFSAVTNPFGIPGTRSAMTAVDVAGWLFVLAGLLLGASAMIARLRRARGDERRQLKLVLAVGFVATTVAAALMATWLIWPTGGLQTRMAVLGFCFATFPLAAGVAILRYRLYEIDAVVTRTLVYGVVTVLLALVFGVTVVLLGTVLGRGSPWATAGATLVVAVAFRPLRGRVQDGVDRRFDRARYDALHRMAEFLEDLRDGRAAPEELEAFLRELLDDPTLELRFFLAESEVYVDAHGMPAAAEAGAGRERIPIERNGQPVGVVLHDPAAEDEPNLLRRVVEAGGLALEIARLRVELRRQLAEVEGSRARIVTAANEERRRIERDLHDGAQQRLVSIGLALRHAQHELGASPERASATLEGAVSEVTVAIDELRELARGLPPAQLDAGLRPAFDELARRASIPVDVRAPRERFDRSLEAAAYFVGCEGLTNAVKHAGARRIVLAAERRNGKLVVSIEDDGVGGAQAQPGSGLSGLADRVAALGGTLRIASDHGAGTTLVAELPCES